MKTALPDATDETVAFAQFVDAVARVNVARGVLNWELVEFPIVMRRSAIRVPAAAGFAPDPLNNRNTPSLETVVIVTVPELFTAVPPFTAHVNALGVPAAMK